MPVKYRVEIAAAAESDIREIFDYIAADNPEYAGAFVTELLGQVSTLEQFPRRCPLVPENEILGTRYRHLVYGHYRTVFRIEGKIVIVMRVLHETRLLESEMRK